MFHLAETIQNPSSPRLILVSEPKKTPGVNIYIALCQELAIQSKHYSEKWERHTELGNFCVAFGLSKIQPLSINKKK